MTIIIRDEQLTALGQARYEDFQNRLLTHLRKHHTERLAEFSDDEVKAFIRTCYDRAKRIYFLWTEQAVVCYSQLPLLLGDDFEVNPDYAIFPALLGRQAFNQNTRAKMALALAYQVNAMEFVDPS